MNYIHPTEREDMQQAELRALDLSEYTGYRVGTPPKNNSLCI